MSKTTIHRTGKKEYLRDKDLSLRSMGLMSLILSMPDEWKYRPKDLKVFTRDGECSISAGFRELRDMGYMTLQRKSHKGVRGVFWVADFYERSIYL